MTKNIINKSKNKWKLLRFLFSRVANVQEVVTEFYLRGERDQGRCSNSHLKSTLLQKVLIIGQFLRNIDNLMTL